MRVLIEASPDDATVSPGGNLNQDITVINTTDSSGTVQASFAARLPNNDVTPLLGPLPQNGMVVEADTLLSRTLDYPVPYNVHSPFIVGFLSFLLDHETGDTLDIDETWVEIIEGSGRSMKNGEDPQIR